MGQVQGAPQKMSETWVPRVDDHTDLLQLVESKYQAVLDAAAGGTLGSKTPGARHLIEEMAMNSYQWNTRDRKKMAEIHEVDAVTSLAAQVESLSKKLDVMASSRIAAITTCNGCGGGHASSDCPIAIVGTSKVEQVDFVDNGFRGQRQGNPYSGTYNSGWKNHPNFSWSN